jgi:hypothetical protein
MCISARVYVESHISPIIYALGIWWISHFTHSSTQLVCVGKFHQGKISPINKGQSTHTLKRHKNVLNAKEMKL